ncbi:MAG: hypothetical protein U0412_07420 [Nitrospira sp.]
MAPAFGWAVDAQTKGKTTNHHLIDHQRIQQLKERVAELKHHHNGNGASAATLESLQAKITALETSVNTLLNANSTMLTTLQSTQGQLATLQAKVAVLESQPSGSGGIPGLERYVTIDPNTINGIKGPHLLITGVNVHIRSGSQATDDGGTPRGLGNLIIGYNESDPDFLAPRTGSHNLVLGQGNGFSSVGGAVLGHQNRITGKFASILGGEQNTASGLAASVLGGTLGTASGYTSTVLGGIRNSALEQFTLAPVYQLLGN